MLRPYLAVIHDSFRAALASRVLYIVLGLIGLILAAVAPLHLRQQTDWQLHVREHFPNPSRLASRLVDQGKTGKRATVAWIWNRLSGDLQDQLVEAATAPEEDRRPEDGPPVPDPVFEQLADELNVLLAERDFYNADAWSGKRLTAETEAMLERGMDSLDEQELKRLNRLLLVPALRGDITPPRATRLNFYYGPWRWDWLSTGMSQAELANTVSDSLISIFDNFVMSIGIFIAILVTASVIPEMLEPGSLNLLLSKPVYRWGLLLAKFVGGCAFILVCAALFFGGIWLWMGVQLDMWESAILWAIPVYLVVFAMYYSVSVLAGICFRSPILCITFAILFWAVCFAIGFGYHRMNSWYYNLSPAELLASGDDVMYVDLQQKNRFWDPTNNDWRVVTTRTAPTEEAINAAFISFIARLDELPDQPGPVRDPDSQVVVASDAAFIAGPGGGGPADWISVHPPNWSATRQGELPRGTAALFAPGNGWLYLINRSGELFRRELPPAADPETADTDTGDDGASEDDRAEPGILNQLMNTVSGENDFEPLGEYDEPLEVRGTRSASMNSAARVAIYSQGNLLILEPDDQSRYEVRRQIGLGQQENLRMTAHVHFGPRAIFVVLGNGRFFHVDATTLETVWSDVIENRAAIRTLSAAPDGSRVAVTFRDGRLWLYDAGQTSELDRYPAIARGDVMAATFDAQGRLWTGDRFRNARCWDLDELQLVSEHQPPATSLTRSFRFLIRPLYRAFPKPGEFHKVLSRLSSTGDTRYNPEIDLTVRTQSDDPWQPLRSGLWFMLVTLGIACWIFQRSDY